MAAEGDLDWLNGLLVGKATKRPALPSILTERGFIQAFLRESRLLQLEVGRTLKDPGVRKRLLESTNIDWRGASANMRKKAVQEMSNLVSGLPSRFAPGVRGILDTESGRVVDDTHQFLGKKFKILGVDPVFALRNVEAIAAINETTSIFFAPEYERQANRFTRRAQDTIAKGLEEGLGSREIGSALRREFSETAINRNYWDTVSAVHVNRARSFSAVSTYAANGIIQYEIVAVMDERTTDICEMMDGTILSVESAVNQFQNIEELSQDIDDIKLDAPFMSVRGDQILSPVGVQVARIVPGGFADKMTPEQLNANNFNTPPYHFRCRTTLVPVLDTADPIPSPVGPPPPGPAPVPPTTPLTVGPDPIGAAKTPEARRKAFLDQLRNDAAFVPGSIRDRAFFPGSAEERTRTQTVNSEHVGTELRRIGQGIVNSDSSLRAKWSKAKTGSFNDRASAYTGLVGKTKRMGIESLPVSERADRRRSFVDKVVDRASPGVESRGFYTKSRTKSLTRKQKDDVAGWAGEFFDAWGPMAEGALGRIKNVHLVSGRNHNADPMGYFTYGDRRSFHHEFAHSLENYSINQLSLTTPRFGDSFWAQRVRGKHPGNPKKMSDATGNPGYGNDEVTRDNRWGDVYMGKVYGQGSTEVVAMVSEGYGGSPGTWRAQMLTESDSLLEFIGWQRAMINGENLRQARAAAAGGP